MIKESVLLSQQLVQDRNGSQMQKKIKEVVKEFESIFLGYMIKTMWESIPKSELFGGGLGQDHYIELMEQELARKLSENGGLGLAAPLQKNLLNRTGVGEKTPVDDRGLGEPRPATSEGNQFLSPVNGRLSSDFGWRTHPLTGRVQFHKGIDLAAPEGVSVAAANAGRVVFSGWQEGFGNTVIIEHTNGYRTRYAHLQMAEVSVGDPISAGQKIGAVGKTGRVTGPHLHFEIWKEGLAMDPKEVL